MKCKMLSIGLLLCSLLSLSLYAGTVPSGPEEGLDWSDESDQGSSDDGGGEAGSRQSEGEQVASSEQEAPVGAKEDQDNALPPLSDEEDDDRKAETSEEDGNEPVLGAEIVSDESEKEEEVSSDDERSVVEEDKGQASPPSSADDGEAETSETASDESDSDENKDQASSPSSTDDGKEETSEEEDNKSVPGAGIASSQSDLDGESDGASREEAKESEKEEEVSFDDESKKKQDSEDPPKSQGLWEAAKNMTGIKLAALTGAVSLLSYGAYKGYEALMALWRDYAEGEQPVKLTVKERNIILSLVEAMAEDFQHVRDGNKQSSAVKQFDIGGLSMPLAIECNFMQHGFIERYNLCDEQGNNVDVLEMFYDQFSELVRSVVNRAEIVPEKVEEASAPTA